MHHNTQITPHNIMRMGSIKLCQIFKYNPINASLKVAIYHRALQLLSEEENSYLWFNARGLATILYQFSIHDIPVEQYFIDAWEREACKQIQDFTPRELALSIHAFGHFALRPSATFIQAWEREACTKIKSFKTQELVNSIEAFKGLEIKPSIQFIEAWERETCDKIEEFNPKYLVFSVYAIYTINNLTNCHIKIPIPILRSIEEKYKILDLRDCHQLWVANADFFQKYQQSLFSNEVLEYLWQYIENNGLAPSYMTRLQQEVSEILSQISPKEIISEKWIPEIASYVDNFISDTNLIIQVDGPTHFNKYEQNSSTKLNTKLLENLGYKVQRISYFVWDQLYSEADKRKYIDRLLQDSYLENDILPLGSCTNNGAAVHDMVFLF
ncbi:RAP domain-containing protein [Candidatus Tisiphia endosymbiont of Nemotelus uliginosus]|uniref:RAP domain-containing protein n=1 Tax=Candidatus Tisiphia endosymbiont of Nemotelus uliginosus TaxID=3077926 RepID=UPI0035C8A03F